MYFLMIKKKKKKKREREREIKIKRNNRKIITNCYFNLFMW